MIESIKFTVNLTVNLPWACYNNRKWGNVSVNRLKKPREKSVKNIDFNLLVEAFFQFLDSHFGGFPFERLKVLKNLFIIKFLKVFH